MYSSHCQTYIGRRWIGFFEMGGMSGMGLGNDTQLTLELIYISNFVSSQSTEYFCINLGRQYAPSFNKDSFEVSNSGLVEVQNIQTNHALL